MSSDVGFRDAVLVHACVGDWHVGAGQCLACVLFNEMPVIQREGLRFLLCSSGVLQVRGRELL